LLYVLLIVSIILFFSLGITQQLGAPWVPTSRERVRKMLSIANVQPNEVVYDLGSGDGRIIIMAAREFGARSVGIEAHPMWVLWTPLLVILYRLKQVQVIWGNFFHTDLREANVVTLYLLQETNQKLQQKLEEKLLPGTRIVSHAFTFPKWTLENMESGVYLYRINGKKS
ncbi:MAG: SAM-dependent methyltransferase, partial [Candidatus Bathyarchaeota archaeon]